MVGYTEAIAKPSFLGRPKWTRARPEISRPVDIRPIIKVGLQLSVAVDNCYSLSFFENCFSATFANCNPLILKAQLN